SDICSPASNAKVYFTEINFKGNAKSNSGTWFEIFNTDTQNINITGWGIESKKKGNLYTFDNTTILNKNTRYIFAEDSVAFKKIHPTAKNIFILKSTLDTNSDTISIVDYSNTTATEAAYNNVSPWPRAANGLGRTLESNYTQKSSLQATDWRLGCVNGSPESDYTTCDDPLVFSEIHYQGSTFYNAGQWFEIHNRSKADINLSGYSIFNLSNGNIFNIPTGKILLKDSFLVLINDTQAFFGVHPRSTPNIQYPYTIAKNNDALILYNNNNLIIQSEIWESDTPWNTMPNGKGYTLELAEDTGILCSPEYWSISCMYGTPGHNRLYICSNIGINTVNEQENKIVVYPNPANDYIMTENLSNNQTIYIYDSRGVLIDAYSNKLGKSRKIETRNWPSGIYFWQTEKQSGRINILR
ncbi:MAG: lamin tail domain-containing protein, partial [Bacteroidetes bacterium]|nr:lamin tail domain-containing protein [Bacteroidota bacterium]